MGLHCMLDLETMGNGNEAAITAIGAVKFDPTVPDGPFQKFYVTVDLESSVACGMKMDASTVKWWLAQSDAARQQMLTDTIDLPTALDAFATWLGEIDGMWGNGATFDNVILRSAYRLTNLKAPWSFRQDQCFRTLNKQFRMEPLERVGTHHNAVDDAENQAIHMRRIVDELRRTTTIANF